jgi:Bacteriophytochrome (light-regulated signal transduction histidine kinase)
LKRLREGDAGPGDEHRPPLVLLDVNLPDMSGFEVCAQIKRNPKTAMTTVLHISASNRETQHLVQGFDSGADSYLVEPVDPAVLVATVKAFLRARQAEDALRRSNEDLERFAYMVAHDLNEPLRTVISHTQLLERHLGTGLDANTSERLQYVIDGAKRMRSFIDDILRYSQSTHVGYDVRTIDVEALLRRVTDSLDASIRECGATITHDTLPTLVADSKIEVVLQNLISNAIKYRRPDVPPQIHVSAVEGGSGWLFSVRDNGIGIDPQYKDRIFPDLPPVARPGYSGERDRAVTIAADYRGAWGKDLGGIGAGGGVHVLFHAGVGADCQGVGADW